MIAYQHPSGGLNRYKLNLMKCIPGPGLRDGKTRAKQMCGNKAKTRKENGKVVNKTETEWQFN